VVIASEIYIDLKSKNHLIPAPDIFIAATAIKNEMQLATLNQGHFSRIKHLKMASI
jgi:predicted nucleic acid-binding protein